MADGYIVDTGVFLRWFIDQDGYEHAREVQREFLDGKLRLETVDFARVEVAEILRKKGYRDGRLSRAMFLAATRVIDDLGITVHVCDVDRVQRAAGLAADYSLRMFDALFMQAALERQLPLLTTDVKLSRAVNHLVPVEILRVYRSDPVVGGRPGLACPGSRSSSTPRPSAYLALLKAQELLDAHTARCGELTDEELAEAQAAWRGYQEPRRMTKCPAFVLDAPGVG